MNKTKSTVQISNKNKPTPIECDKWYTNQSINPRNGRPLVKNGRIYKTLRENCTITDKQRKTGPIKRSGRSAVEPKLYTTRIQKTGPIKRSDLSVVEPTTRVPKQTQYATIHIPNKHSNSPYKKGDIIKIDEDGYRNEDTFICGGSYLLPLDYNIDDYGGLPYEFTFPEFPLTYWDKSIDHNYIRWVDDTIKDILIKNYDPEQDTTYLLDNGTKRVFIRGDNSKSLLDILLSRKYYVESDNGFITIDVFQL